MEIEIGDECCVCYTEFDEETTVMFQEKQDSEWKKGAYCYDCTQYLIDNNWKKYMDDVEKADCKRSLRNALKCGPPINMRDVGFPCENEGEVFKFKTNNIEFSAKLKDSLEGEKRHKWWNDYKAILDAMEDLPEKLKLDETQINNTNKKDIVQA
jgi:hypothetical protein